MQFLRFFLLQSLLLFAFTFSNPQKAIALDFNYIKEKTFFFKDIHNFRGKLFKSKPINKDYFIQQTFRPSCDQFNRLVIPFYFENSNQTNNLTFNLFKESNLKNAFFSESISPNSWEKPLKLGSFKHYGKFHYIWIPPIQDSKNQSFTFEIRSNDIKSTTGVYLHRLKHHQVSSIRENGQELPGVYTGIFSYCKTNFDLKEISQIIVQRTEREKIFFIIYFLGIAAFLFAIKQASKNSKKYSLH